MLFIDLDGFTTVNDTHGHAAGDLLLLEVSRRLTSLLRPGDTLARLSGDEFVLLLEDLNLTSDAELIAERVSHALRAPYGVAAVGLTMAGSIGVAVTDPGEVITPQLVIDADRAMYEAKATGGGTHRLARRTVGTLPTQSAPGDVSPAR